MKDNRKLIAVILLAAAGVAVFFLFTMMNKKQTDTSATRKPPVKPQPNQATATLIRNAASITDLGNNKLAIQTVDNKNFVIPKPSGTKFSAAPELRQKLTAKYGAGELFQKGNNLTDGFEWVTNTGTTQLSFKDFITLSKS